MFDKAIKMVLGHGDVILLVLNIKAKPRTAMIKKRFMTRSQGCAHFKSDNPQVDELST